MSEMGIQSPLLYQKDQYIVNNLYQMLTNNQYAKVLRKHQSKILRMLLKMLNYIFRISFHSNIFRFSTCVKSVTANVWQVCTEMALKQYQSQLT